MAFTNKYDLTKIVMVDGYSFAYSKRLNKVLVMSSDKALIAATSGKIDMTYREWEDEDTRTILLRRVLKNL